MCSAIALHHDSFAKFPTSSTGCSFGNPFSLGLLRQNRCVCWKESFLTGTHSLGPSLRLLIRPLPTSPLLSKLFAGLRLATRRRCATTWSTAQGRGDSPTRPLTDSTLLYFALLCSPLTYSITLYSALLYSTLCYIALLYFTITFLLQSWVAPLPCFAALSPFSAAFLGGTEVREPWSYRRILHNFRPARQRRRPPGFGSQGGGAACVGKGQGEPLV